MELYLEKRKLIESEVDTIVEEIKKFPNPLNGKQFWKELNLVYVVSSQNNLIGVCGVRNLKSWIKLGPFVVFQKYHGKGYGKKIVEAIVTDYRGKNMFIGSRNPAVAKIATNFGFHEEKNVWNLPTEIKLFLLGTISEIFNIHYMREVIRKKPMSEGPYRFFLKEK